MTCFFSLIQSFHRQNTPIASDLQEENDTDVAFINLDVIRVNHDKSRSAGPRWLLLIHQLPAKPAYARVKVWRRLQALGAVTVKNAVYALPANAETREDFAWLAKEIVESGGEAIVCEAGLVDGLSDRELQALFDAARDEDYARIAGEAREVARASVTTLPDNALAEIASQTARLRKQLDAVVAIDFFGADGREPAEGLVSGLEAGLQQEDKAMSRRTDADGAAARPDCKGRIWVTRAGRADRSHRLGLADPPLHRSDGARFKFVPGTGYAAAARRAALRHVRRRVHPSRRPLHLRGAAGACRPRRSRAGARSARSSTTST